MFFFIPEIYDEQEVLRKYFSNAAKLIWFAIFFFFLSPSQRFQLQCIHIYLQDVIL